LYQIFSTEGSLELHYDSFFPISYSKAVMWSLGSSVSTVIVTGGGQQRNRYVVMFQAEVRNTCVFQTSSSTLRLALPSIQLQPGDVF